MPPRTVFVVPYRARPTQRELLMGRLETCVVSEATGDWEILFVHQNDERPFNRGAMKNLGFLWIRHLYPSDYRSITLVFHDVDTWPRWPGQFPYQTEPGVVAHYYGSTHSLGGVVAIKAGDFERTGGFPNFWAWGLEDNALQDRCTRAGLTIDRRVFFPLRHPAVGRSFDGFERQASPQVAAAYKYGNPGTWRSLRGVRWEAASGGFLNVYAFECESRPSDIQHEVVDIRGGTRLRADRRFVPPPPPAVHPPRTRSSSSWVVSHVGLGGRKRIKAAPGARIRRWPPR